MATLTANDVGDGLSAVSFVSASAGGDVVLSGANAGDWHQEGTYLLVNNADAADIDVTVQGVVTAITAGEIGVIPVNTGRVDAPIPVTYSAVVAVTVAAIRT